MDEQGVISVVEHSLDLHTLKETEARQNKGLFRYLSIAWISIH